MTFKKGRTRFVIIIYHWAIKVPQFRYKWSNFLEGLLCNIQEVKFSKMKDDRMCPIKFYIPGGWLVVMPRCESITDLDYSNIDINKFWPAANEDYHPDNMCDKIKFNVPVEQKQDSFGYYNDNIVAIDYGS